MKLTPLQSGHLQLGFQRDWIWRGWKVRYTFAWSGQARSGEEATPLLLLHGFGSALTQWHENILPLSQAHPVYALDLVGFGVSEKASTTYKVGLWVEQIYEFWRVFINRPIALVGHSLGALVALSAAVAHPEMVERLILITLPAARQEILPGWLQPLVASVEGLFTTPLLVRPLFKLVLRPGVIRSVLRKVYINQERVTEALIESFLQPGYDRGASRAFCRLAQARTQTDFSRATKELLQEVDVPILLLWGEQDRVIPLTWGKHIANALHSQLQLVEIPDAGHCPYDESAERVNAEILAWLATAV
ncbi:alpha/beta fold hydrolase [Leptolyngbya sp. NK1-12]|uniref:Alpha/beta fold hydrolase n=1 Tax=Leptolyngbya sp. NK1-12 TaxID=2547451 RepID=A0AA96WS82_9CYAN|nr:alpha/beta fold hydrolase [Leptolyngbya sp. NK1-12]